MNYRWTNICFTNRLMRGDLKPASWAFAGCFALRPSLGKPLHVTYSPFVTETARPSDLLGMNASSLTCIWNDESQVWVENKPATPDCP